MIYLYGTFFVLWAITFGYVYSIHTRQKRLEQELEAIHPPQDTPQSASHTV